jgi:hypothetical protein
MSIGISPPMMAASAPVMHRAEYRGYQAVLRHRQPDARLRNDHGDDHRGQTQQRPDLHPARQPDELGMGLEGDGDRRGIVQPCIGHQARQHR